MKVEKINQSTQTNVVRNRNRNLAGFGSGNTSVSEQVTSFNNKKSNEAIRSQFLSNLSFEGRRDELTVTADRKYGDRYLLSTSGQVIRKLDPGESVYEGNRYRTRTELVSEVYHARLSRSGTRASGSDSAYVAKEAITESPYFYSGSTIKEYSPIRGRVYDKETKSVYFSDPGERLDETVYADYVVYAPGAYYKKRTFWEKL